MPRLVFLAPLLLIGLGLRELLLDLGSVLRGFARGMLDRNRSATCRHEGDDQYRHGDQTDDEPRNHAGQEARLLGGRQGCSRIDGSVEYEACVSVFGERQQDRVKGRACLGVEWCEEFVLDLPDNGAQAG